MSQEQAEFVYKVTPAGDGSVYGWTKYNRAGEVVETSQQQWPAAMDAEKAARALADGVNSIVEVDAVRNINSDANAKVEVVNPEANEVPGVYGATPVDQGVTDEDPEDEEAAAEDVELDAEPVDPEAPEGDEDPTV